MYKLSHAALVLGNCERFQGEGKDQPPMSSPVEGSGKVVVEVETNQEILQGSQLSPPGILSSPASGLVCFCLSAA
eukprot:766404-Hanusia_phi.AAC.6